MTFARIMGVLFIIGLIILFLFYGEENRDLFIAFAGSLMGGLFTLIGVNISLRQSQRLSYGKFFVHFNKAQVSINRFIRKSKLLSNKLSGADRHELRFMYPNKEFLDLKDDIGNTIKALNKEISDIDYTNFGEDILDINENCPIEYYYKLNNILIIMISIYNTLLDDGKYLMINKPNPILISPLSMMRMEKPHYLQIKILERQYKKIKRKMILK